MVNCGIPWFTCFKAPWITLVSMVYHGILPWFTVIYHGLPGSKHKVNVFKNVVFVTVTYELPSYRDSHLQITKLS